ncbi:MAG: long-chain-fatty-acid--CoA ligase [Rhodobacteraceae bacterium]|nr:long-chain-fatty-acid--CoA ligase [Paracoccaceae bacterium]
MQCRHFGVWPEGLPHSLPPSEHSVLHNLNTAAAVAPDRTAIWYYGNRITYDALAVEVRSLAGFLHHRLGIRSGDRVAIYMQNAPQFVVAYYAILAANAVIVPVSPMCRRAELLHIIQDSGPRAIIHGAELAEEAAAVWEECGRPGLIHAHYRDYAADGNGFPGEPAAARIGTAWADALGMACPAPAHDRRPEDWCMIQYSSGTTGQPKGCLHTHASVNAVIFGYTKWIGVAPGSRILASLPLFHVTGMQNSMNLPILTGSTIYLMTRWNAALAARLIQQEQIEYWRSITTMMIDFLSLPGIGEIDVSSLRAIGGGGAQMPAEIARRMSKLIGLDYIEAYGLSETMAPTHINPPQAPKRQCLGIPIFDVDCRIVDPDTLAELGPNEAGEIVTHGPQLFQGYWRRPEETEAAILTLDGKRFLRTGDVGYMDAEGYFFFVDRLKRMVNVSGFKVWPAEVEAILHGHPEIKEACIVGDPDPRTGEAVRAVIVPCGESLDTGRLKEWCRANMAAYKVPARFDLRDRLPRSGAGKVLWKKL